MKRTTFIHSKVMIAILMFVMFSLQSCASKEEKRDAFFNKGVSLYEDSHYEEAILELKNAVQLDPDYIQAHLYLARAYLKQGDFGKARGSLSKALALDSDQNEVRLGLSLVLLMARQGEKALNTIRPLLQKDQDNPEALLIAAQAYLLERKPDKALEALTKIDQTKRDKRVLMTFAGAYNQTGDTEKVKEYLSHYQKAAPEDPTSYLELSRIYAGEKQLDKAEDEFRKLIKQKKGETHYPLLLCKFLLNTKQEKKVQLEFERLIAESPQENIYRVAYAEHLSDQKKFGQAQVLLREAIRKDPNSWEVRNGLVEAYVAEGKMTEALREVDVFLQSSPKEGKIDALLKKGQIMAQLGRWKGCENQCDMALAMESNYPDAHLLKAKVLLQGGYFEEAIVHLRQVVDTKPSESQGHLFLAKALALSGELPLAIEQLKAGLEILPQDEALRMALISDYQKEREWEYAMEATNAGLQQRPQDPLFLIQKGRILTGLGKLDQAETVFKSIIDSQPETNTGYVELGRLKGAEGDDAEAIALFEKALPLRGDTATPLKLLIDTYLKTNQEEKAEALCKEVLKANPANALAYATLGSIDLQQAKYQEAEKHFKAAIQASLYWEEPYHSLLRVYAMINRLEEAKHNLEVLYLQDPESFSTEFSLALVYEKLDEYDKAIASAEDLIAKHPHVVAILKNLACLYAKRAHDAGGLKKALEYGRKALAKAPDDPQVLDSVAWIEFKLGHIDKALNYIRRAVNEAEEDPMINYHAGVISANMNEKIAARKYLSKAIELGLEKGDAETSQYLLKSL